MGVSGRLVEEETDEMVNQVGARWGRVGGGCVWRCAAGGVCGGGGRGEWSTRRRVGVQGVCGSCVPAQPQAHWKPFILLSPVRVPACLPPTTTVTIHHHHCSLLQVLDQIGIDLVAGSVAAPKQRVPASRVAAPEAAAATQEDEEADDLVARLAALK